MRLLTKTVVALLVLGIFAGVSVDGQKPASPAATPSSSFTRLTVQELNLLLKHVAEVNPNSLKRFEEDSESKRAQLDGLRDLLALASEAQKTGLANGQIHQTELESIRAEVTAVSYDRHVNKGKAEKGSFGYITDGMVASYWGETPGSTLSATVKAERNAKFERFLNAKVHFLRSLNPLMKDREVAPEERQQARNVFAKIESYAAEYAKRSLLLPLAIRQSIALQVKLQQAQFLAQVYREKTVTNIVATDAEAAAYLKKHPELDATSKRAKAEGILARAKAGEDFAKLANQFSEDPGNKNQQDEPQGGLYANVGKGVMVPPFEQAALALEPGQIAPQLVESDFGFHVMKLERKNVGAEQTYDVRHILIATAITDPSNPAARPVPAKEYARREVEREKERLLIDKLVVSNKISVPEDFVVPSAVAKPEPKVKPAAKRRPARKRT